LAPPHGPAALTALQASLRERLAALRGVDAETLPPALLSLTVQRVPRPGGDVYVVRPAEWEQLRHEEGGAGRPTPYWATPWPSGLALAHAVAEAPPPAGARVLELGCGLALPSIAAARAGARVLATDGSTDAVAFAAHGLALNELEGEVAHADWAAQGEALVARGPFDVVLAADVLYLRRNAEPLPRLLPRLLAPGAVVRLADPGRAAARDFLAAARALFHVRTVHAGEVALHELRRKTGRS
jgi:predicted nicotinamide N-methyase